MSRGLVMAVWVALVCGGCKFDISYPDSFAPEDLGGADLRGEDGTVTPDTTTPDSVEPDVEPVKCSLDSECEFSMGVARICTLWKCEAGECKEVSGSEGQECDDGSPCTWDDHCSGGKCQGQPTCQDDGNPCTREECNPQDGSCSSVTIPECGNCKPEGEKVGPLEECCGGLEPVATCSSEPGCGQGMVPCPDYCCDGVARVCIKPYDGVCAYPWETECNSADCQKVVSDECTLAGGFCIAGVYTEPDGSPGPCGEGYEVSNLTCAGRFEQVCCLASGCIMTGSSGPNMLECCDGTAQKIPVVENWVTPVEGDPGSSMDCVLSTTQSSCTQCGDGVCGEAEFPCNCTQDCAECQTLQDCPAGAICLGFYCIWCGLQQCGSGLDDDCDGQIEEAPCQQTTCSFDTTSYQPVPLQLLVQNLASYKGEQVAVLGWSKMGAPSCLGTPVACQAELRLIDHESTLPALPLTSGGSGIPLVGCTGLIASAMTCGPFAAGQSVLVWGKVVSKENFLRLEYHGHCLQ